MTPTRRHDDDRPIAVLGATGQQGGAVVSALLAEGVAVRAVVRDPHAPAALALSARGARTVVADQSDPDSLLAAFTGARGVFSVQPSSGQAGSGMTDRDEVAYGTGVVDAAVRAGVPHVVYSSANAVSGAPTGVGHFDTKAAVEDHVRRAPIWTTILRPAAFMEILLLPGTSLGGGTLTFLNRADQRVQLVAVADIGRVAAAAFADAAGFAGRTIELAGDAASGEQVAAALSEAAGRPVDYARLPDDVLDADPLLGKLAALIDDGALAGRADLDALRAEFPFLLDLRSWLAGPGAPLLHQALRTTAGNPVALR
ncbi:NmrA/HSCARG family protein [Actinokineospora bangkokensis]|uniref:NmrA family protein n=1 Tax=Actinokineospora bangkokensis TaxID=1193682 RepID=A0A1Q9LL81_9PSEU|nr:NmrA/HSCARG family protein [Actinokineospora bangkokensis]OLR92798.1 NmrA family protein [Actinokineospora bangkokensis]